MNTENTVKYFWPTKITPDRNIFFLDINFKSCTNYLPTLQGNTIKGENDKTCTKFKNDYFSFITFSFTRNTLVTPNDKMFSQFWNLQKKLENFVFFVKSKAIGQKVLNNWLTKKQQAAERTRHYCKFRGWTLKNITQFSCINMDKMTLIYSALDFII